MTAMLRQLGVQVRLHFRNRMALLYSYLFPTIFLVAFWVLYRYEAVPLVRHMGELLTVTALGGACFGLPTSLVSERERGVWRRYRLAPVREATLVSSTLVARYLLLLTAGLLQLGLAMGVFGMPAPERPVELLLAFTLVSFAFLGLGLVIAALADDVPAVQALGQSIFLPMLVIGGVAVRIESLPAWAQHLSAYFPGRYAVEAIQVTVAGDGLGGSAYAVFALVAIGGAAFVAGARLFRWDQQQRFARLPGKRWVAAAVVGWVFVGALAQATGQVSVGVPLGSGSVPVGALFGGGAGAEGPGESSPPLAAGDTEGDAAAETGTSLVSAAPPFDPPAAPTTSDGAEAPVTELGEAAGGVVAPDAGPVPLVDAGEPADEDGATPADPGKVDTEPSARPEPAVATAGEDVQEAAVEPAPQPGVEESGEAAVATAADVEPWRAVTMEEIDGLDYSSLPPDDGVVAPVARFDEDMPLDVLQRLQCIRSMLGEWPPGRVDDPVQRVRNFLYVAAVPDMLQMGDMERWIPLVVFQHLLIGWDRDELMRILFWIVKHPEDGDDWGSTQLHAVCLNLDVPTDAVTLRERTYYYAMKLLGRMAGYLGQE